MSSFRGFGQWGAADAPVGASGPFRADIEVSEILEREAISLLPLAQKGVFYG